MTEVSRRIALSSHVDIYGVGGSAMLAEEMQGRLYRDRGQRARVVGGAQRADQRGDPGLRYRRHRHLGDRAHGRDDRDAGRGRSRGAFTVAITNNPTSPLAELADRSIVTSVYEQFLQPDDLSAKHGQLLVLDLLYLLIAQENFDRSTRQSRRIRPRRLLAPAASSYAAARDGHRQGGRHARLGRSAAASEEAEE